jgi:hypothetical protein
MQNRSYRQLNLPFEFQRPTVDFSEKKHVKFDPHSSPELISFLKKLNLKAGMCEVFRRTYEPFSNIHLDNKSFDDHCKLIIVDGSDSSSMVWWKLKPDCNIQIGTTVVGSTYCWANKNDCIEVARITTMKPLLANVGQFHNVIDVFTPRTAWTFNLLKEDGSLLFIDEAIEIFSDFIIN